MAKSVSERVALYRGRNKEKCLERTRDWRLRNKHKVRAYSSSYYAKNKESILKSQKDARLKNPEKFREKWKKIDAVRRATNHGRLNVRIGNLIRQSLRRKGGRPKNNTSWNKCVGYSLQEFTTHIERQFSKGMTWGNHGEWHIEHIRPLSLFNFSSVDEEGFKQAWALTNLRPLWKEENLNKKNKAVFLL